MFGISLKQLEVFVAVAAAGSVRGAAEQLCVTQPAVSMALAELERQLDTHLFDRARGRLSLSQRGKELLPLAQQIIERVEELIRRNNDEAQTLSGRLSLGTSNTVGNYLVGELLGPFMTAHPKVAVNVKVENTATIISDLIEHRIDVACVEGQVNHPELELISWREDALLVCAAPSHPLAQATELKAQDFKDARWILREPGSAMRVLAERALGSLPPGQIILELGQVESIKQAVIAGLGIACLPSAAVVDAVTVGRLKILDTPFLDLRRRLSLVLLKSRYRGALVNAFMACTLPSGTLVGSSAETA